MVIPVFISGFYFSGAETQNSQVLGMLGRHLPHLWIGSQSYRGGQWQRHSDQESPSFLTVLLMGGSKVDPLACVLIIRLWNSDFCWILDLPYFLGSLPGSFNCIIMQTYACLNDILTHSFSWKVQTQIHFWKNTGNLIENFHESS